MKRYGSVFVLSLALVLVQAFQVPAITPVAIYNDTGVWQDGKTALESMLTWAGIAYQEITASQINSSQTNLSALYETIIMPGGNAGYYNGAYGNPNYINSIGKANLRDFVNNGGGYLGICAGAYFAADKILYSADGGLTFHIYDDAAGYDLDLWNGTAAGPMNEIATYNPATGVYNAAMVTLDFSTDNDVLAGYGADFSADVLYFGGPAFIDFEEDTTVLATYSNLEETVAVVAGSYGSGKIVLFGPHPEIEEDSVRDATPYAASLDDTDSEWQLMQNVLAYLGTGGPHAVGGGYSRYDFTYYYNSGSGDYYTGFVYAPTTFQTFWPLLNEGTYLYEQPMEMWATYKSFNGGYYLITDITDGYDSSYDKMSYITSYFDADGAQTLLEVNTVNPIPTLYADGHVLVVNRPTTMEAGYAFFNAAAAFFNPYQEVTFSAVFLTSSGLPPATLSSTPLPPPGQAVWEAYRTDYLADEQQ